MSSKIADYFGSLAFKFLLLYVISLLLIISVFVILIDSLNTRNALNTIQQTLEIGPGYLHGSTPETVATPKFQNYLPASEVISEFIPMDTRATTTPGDDRRFFLNYTIPNDDEPGPITIYRDSFPRAFSLGLYLHAERTFYYTAVPGYDDVVIIAAIDQNGLNELRTAENTRYYALYLSPLLLVLAIMFGWMISRQATAPIKRLAKATELMSHSDLSQRVKYRSRDEIGRLAHSFNSMAERLENAFSSQKRFISEAAHELRTPLASMKTALSLALSQPRKEEYYQEILIKLSERADILERLVNDMLLLARLDEDAPVTAAATDMTEVITKASEVFQPLFEDKDIRYTSQVENSLYVKGERIQLIRLISNLLDNAAKYTPEGGRITVKASAQNTKVIIQVQDTGCGISPEFMDKIFERFFRIPDAEGNQKGFGLGLALCRSIAKKCGGEISVKSIVGEGSTFIVDLPLVSSPKS